MGAIFLNTSCFSSSPDSWFTRCQSFLGLIFVPYWKGCFLRLTCATFCIGGNDEADVMETVAFGGQFNGQQRGRSAISLSLRLIMQSINQFH